MTSLDGVNGPADSDVNGGVEEDSGLQTDKNEGTTGGQQRGNKLWRT